MHERKRRGPVDPRLLAYASGARFSLGGAVAVGLVSAASIAVQALALGELLAGVFPLGRGAGLPTALGHHRAILIATLVAAGVVRALCALWGEIAARVGASRVKAEIRRSLIALACLRTDTGEGHLATVAGRGLDALDVYVGRCVPNLVLAGAVPFMLLGVLAWQDWLSAAIVVFALVLFPLFGVLVGKTTSERAQRRWDEVTNLGAHISDLFEGLAVLKAYGRSGDERARVSAMSDQLRQASLATLRLAFLSALVLDVLASTATALVAVPIGIRLVYGSMALAPGLAVLIITPEVFVPLRRASADFHDSAEGLAAVADAFNLLEATGTHDVGSTGTLATSNEVVAVRGPRDAHRDRTPPRIELRGVTVTVAGRAQPVLDDVSLDIAPGETVAVVGPNGAGKSTLLLVALGLMVAQSGDVRVDGLTLADDDVSTWRAACVYLPDRPTLLGASIFDNVAVADRALTKAGCAAALGDARATFVELLPAGFDTKVGDGGHTLSAGERQRLALARAFVRAARCYFLDEPTAHLDEATELAVLHSIKRRTARATTVIVTHSPAVLALADRIVRLDNGKLIELDTADAPLTSLIGSALAGPMATP